MRKPFRTMEELVEIKKTHRRNRNNHEVPNEKGRRERLMINHIQDQVEIISSVMERAIEVQSNLSTQFPSFVKPMIRSNVTGGFWLSLPKLFCDLHLPSHDIEIKLVDESHEEYYTKYLPYRRGLSAGWKGFSIAHNLQEGDILIFHLVGFCKMKVYIVRANQFSAADAALSLLHLQAHAKFVNYGFVLETMSIQGHQSLRAYHLSTRLLVLERAINNHSTFSDHYQSCICSTGSAHVFCSLFKKYFSSPD